MRNDSLTQHWLMDVTPDTSELERKVMSWFAAGHEVLWIPIYEVADNAAGIADAMAEFAHFGGARLIGDVRKFFLLPIGIKGWLFPAHLDDTDVVCRHDAPGEVSFGHLQHPTGERLTYRYPTEAPIRRQMCHYRD